MPFGEYKDFDECVSKNSDKDNPQAYCGYIKNQVEEALKRKEASEAIKKATEIDPNLLTPKKQETEPITLQSTQGEVSEDSEIKTNDKYGKLDGDKYSKNEDTVKDEKREEQQGQATEQDDLEQAQQEKEDAYSRVNEPNEEEEDKVEYEGENYKLFKISKEVLNGNVIEYNNKFYTPLRLKEKIGEADIDYQGTVYRPRTHNLIEYNNRIYEAVNPHTDAEPPQDQALGDKDNVDDARPLELPAEEEISVSGPPAGTEPTVLEDELKQTGENIVVKTRKGYKKLRVYEVDTSSNKLENLKNRGFTKDDKKNDKKDDKETKKKA